MSFVATTISEHIRNEGRTEGMTEGMTKGMKKGITKGMVKGKLEGQIETLENLYLTGILNREQYESMIQPVRKQLQEIQSDPDLSVDRPERAAKGRRKPKASGQAEP